MLKLVKRPESPFWQIVGTCPYARERIRKSTGCDREDEARKVLAAFLSRRHTEAVHGPQSATLVAEAVLEYIDKGGDARFMGPILDNLGKRRMIDVEDRDLSDVARKEYPGAKPSTLVRQLYGPFQAVWNAAARARMVAERTIAKPKVPKTRVKPANDAQFFAILTALTKVNQKAAVLFMSYSGARSSEVVAVRTQDHNPDRATVFLAKTKNEDSRVVHLPPFVNEALKLLPHTKPDALLFQLETRWALNTMIARACDRAGVERLTPHQIGRHTFARRFLEGGNSTKALMDAGGWKSLAAVEKYAFLDASTVEAAVRNIHPGIDTQQTHDDMARIASSGKKKRKLA